MSDDFRARYLADTRARFRWYKELGERALDQVTEDEWFISFGPESNSIAVIVKHVGGNLRSRWTKFLSTDGEKPDRHRDTEFELSQEDSPGELLRRWEGGWSAVLRSLGRLKPADLNRRITIRGRPLDVHEAASRSLTHTAYHVGQIVQLARYLKGDDWKTLSIPRGQSEQFMQEMLAQKDGNA